MTKIYHARISTEVCVDKLWGMSRFGDGDKVNRMAMTEDRINPLSKALRACRKHLIGVAWFSALVNVLYFTPVIYMMQVYERAIPTRGYETLFYLTLIAVVAFLVMGVFETLRQRVVARIGLRLDRWLAEATALREFAARNQGKHVAGGRSLDVFRNAITGPGVIAAFDAPWAPLFIGVVFIIHASIGWFVLVGALVLIGVSVIAQSRMFRDQIAADEAAAKANGRLEAAAQAAGATRALGMWSALATRQAEDRERSARLAFETNMRNAGLSALSKGIRLALQSGVIGLGAYLAIDRQISPAAVFAASILGARALQPIDGLIASWRSIVQGLAAYRKLGELFSLADPNQRGTPLPPPEASLEVEQLVVQAPNDRGVVIKNVSFKIRPGEIVALIGPSGAGKSTLAQAIVGAMRAESGVVRIDGADASQWPSDELGRQVGYLPQDNALIEGTIADNISRFRRWNNETMEALGPRLLEAAKATGAHDLILRLSDGYDTVIGQNGRGLSGGQAQRIALARAFFDQPPILVLDEPNAHLDTDGERALTRALSLHRERNGSALVIAQRTAILSVCDRVILMVDGKIAADGTLDQILEFTGLRPSGVETAKPVGALRASPKSKQNDLSHEAVDQSSEIESAS